MQQKPCRGMGFVLAGAIWLGAAATASAQFTWTGLGVDDNWTSPGNWAPDTGYPSTTAHDAIFTNLNDEVVDVNDDISIRYLRPRQAKDVINTYMIASVKTFAPYYYHGVNESIDNKVFIKGGTFKPRTTLIVGYQTTAGPSATPVAHLVLTNTVFDTGNLAGGIHVGCNFWSIGNPRGELDVRGADIHHQGVPNVLNVPQLWLARNWVNINRGRLWLPPSVTNITVNSLIMQGVSDLDLGAEPQLETLVIASEALIGRGYITYRDGGGNTHTNLPPNVALKIGSPGTPAAFDFGNMYNVTLNMRWGGFRRFEGYFSRLNIGRSANDGTAFAELDLASMGELAGDFTDRHVETPILRLGGGPRNGAGILKLPGTVTNLTFNTFELGNVPDLYGPPYSVLHLGSNTQLRAITVRDDFRIGRGEFQYVDGGGTPHTGLPGGIAFRVGTEGRRAALRVGNCHQINTVTVFGPDLETFEGWLSELWIGKPAAGWANHNTSATLDLRGVDVVNLDVDGAVTMGTGVNDQSTFHFASSPMRCSSFTIGRAGNATLSYNKVSTLNLSNAVVTVTNAAAINETGRMTATLDGHSAGFDLGTDSLSVAEPFVTHPQFYGRIDLVFASDPLVPQEDYFGLRLKGDAVAELQALHAASPSRLTWNIDGLSLRYQQRFGIHYDANRDLTIVGVERTLRGMMIMLR